MKEEEFQEIEMAGQNTDSQLFYWTSHPFVDAGLAAILLLNTKEDPKDLTDDDIKYAIEFVSELYFKPDWIKYLSRVFRNNNSLLMINPSMRNMLSSDKLKSSLNALFKLIKLSVTNKGVCEICGRYPPIDAMELRKTIHTKSKEKPKEITGDVFPLLGTGDLSNFFPSGNFLGANICAHCLFLAQIAPIGMHIISGKKGGIKGILAIHVYPQDKMLYFVKDAIHNARISYSIPDRHGYKLKENFLVHKVIELTQKIDSMEKLKFWKNLQVILYFFINGNRANEQRVEITPIPSTALRFIAYATVYDKEGLWENRKLM